MTDLPGLPSAQSDTPDAPHRERVEIKLEALGLEGMRLMGRVQALQEAANQVLAWSRQTIDLQERRTLLNAAKGLAARLEEERLALAKHATARGAVVTPKPKLVTVE